MEGISDEVLEVARNLFDGGDIDYNIDRHGKATVNTEELPDLDNYEYTYGTTRAEILQQAIDLIVKILPNVTFYNDYNDTGIYLELSDNHTFWDINEPEGFDGEFDYDLYNFFVEQAFDEFENQTGVEAYQCGRSGRHICVKVNFDNILNYDKLCLVQAELEQQVIGEAESNCFGQALEEAKDLAPDEKIAKCLSCGMKIKYKNRDVQHDAMGDYIECPNCHSTFDVDYDNTPTKKTEDLSPAEEIDLADDINTYLMKNQLYPVDVFAADTRVMVEIEWGDWKHDHLRCDALMKAKGYTLVEEEVTEEDGSDCFSAIRHYEPKDKFKDIKTEAEDYSTFTPTNKVLSGNKGLSEKEIDEIRGSLPDLFKDMTDEQKQIWKELSLRGMVMSCLVYDEDIHTSTVMNAVSKYYKQPYVNEYYDTLGKDVTEEIIKQQTEYFNKGKVIKDVGTDSDGLSYNSFVEPEEESKKVTEAKYGDSNPDKIVPDAYCEIEKTDTGYYINCGIGTHTNLGSGNFTIYPEDYLSNLHKEVKKLAKERGIKRVYDKVKTIIPEYNAMIPEYNASIENMIKDLTPFAEKSKQGQLTRADLDSIEEITGKITPNRMSTLPEFEWSGKFGKLRSLIGNLKRYETDLSNPLASADTITITESKEVKTEAEDMTQVKDDIETAVEKSDSTDLEKEQVKGSLDVLKTDEESAIEGYEDFRDETEKVADKELADAVNDQMEEIVDDEKEHIEKLDTIKSALGESKEAPRLTGDETYVAINSSGYKSIGLIVDNTNKQFQIINGQVMTTDSKTKKMSKKQIRDKAQQLYDNGYTEYDGYGSVAQGVEKKTEAEEKLYLDGKLFDKLEKATELDFSNADIDILKLMYKRLDDLVVNIYDNRNVDDIETDIKNILSKANVLAVKLPIITTVNEAFNLAQVVRHIVGSKLEETFGYDFYYESRKVKKEDKQNITEDTASSEFNLYIKPEELADVNISSLLFDSDTVIADYKEGNYMLSLIVRGAVKIYDNETGYAYKNYQDFPVDLQSLIKSGALGSGDDTNKYTVDMNNWFEWFLDEVEGNAADTLWYDVADIEGMLNKPTPEENETELEVIMKDLFDDIIGQLNESKKIESKDIKTETVKIMAYGKLYYEYSDDEWNSKSEDEKDATIIDVADQATEEEGHTVYEDEVEVITENRKVTEAKDDLEGIKNLIVYEKTQDIFEELYHNEHLDCEYNGSNGVVKITSADEHTFNIIDKVMVDKLHYSKLSNYVYELNEGPIYRDIKGGFDFKGYSYKVDVKFSLNEKDTVVGTVGISEIDVKKENKNLTEDITSKNVDEIFSKYAETPVTVKNLKQKWASASDEMHGVIAGGWSAIITGNNFKIKVVNSLKLSGYKISGENLEEAEKAARKIYINATDIGYNTGLYESKEVKTEKMGKDADKKYSNLYKYKGKAFAYDNENAIVEYVYVDPEDNSWIVLDEIGLSNDNWDNKEARDEYLDEYIAQLDDEANRLADDFIANEYLGESLASRYVKTENKSIKTEASEGTATLDANSDLLPIINMYQYDLYNMCDDLVPPPNADMSKDVDEAMLDIAEPIIEEEIKGVLPSAQITFKEYKHPQYYRAFSNLNDVLYFDITYNVAEYEALKEKAIKDPEFEQYLKDHYKSYDGFMSFFADNLTAFNQQEEWKQFVSVLSYYLPNDDEANYNTLLYDTYDKLLEMGYDHVDSIVDGLVDNITDRANDGEMTINTDTVTQYVKELYGDVDQYDYILDGVLNGLSLSESKKLEAKSERGYITGEVEAIIDGMTDLDKSKITSKLIDDVVDIVSDEKVPVDSPDFDERVTSVVLNMLDESKKVTEAEVATATKSAGEYWVGDPCYVVPDDIYQGIWGDKYKFKDGTIDCGNGLSFQVHGTAWGDGEYKGSNGFIYGVDAGVLAIVPMELATKERGLDKGTRHKSSTAKLEYKDGIFNMIFDNETITINTDPSEDLDESKQLKKEDYEVRQDYYDPETGEATRNEYVMSFDTWEEAQRFADGLAQDPNCTAWVNDTSKDESKKIEDKELLTENDEIPVVNPDEQDYYNNKGYIISLYPRSRSNVSII